MDVSPRCLYQVRNYGCISKKPMHYASSTPNQGNEAHRWICSYLVPGFALWRSVRNFSKKFPSLSKDACFNSARKISFMGSSMSMRLGHPIILQNLVNEKLQIWQMIVSLLLFTSYPVHVVYLQDLKWPSLGHLEWLPHIVGEHLPDGAVDRPPSDWKMKAFSQRQTENNPRAGKNYR